MDKASISQLVGWGFLVYLLIVWLYVIIAAWDLSAARQYGRRFNEECGPEYMEYETPRYQILRQFKETDGMPESVYKRLEKSIYMLCFLGIVLAIVIGASYTNFQNKLYLDWIGIAVIVATMVTSFASVMGLIKKEYIDPNVGNMSKINPAVLAEPRKALISTFANAIGLAFGFFAIFGGFLYKGIIITIEAKPPFGISIVTGFGAWLMLILTFALTLVIFDRWTGLTRAALVRYQGKLADFKQFLADKIFPAEPSPWQLKVQSAILADKKRVHPTADTVTADDFMYILHRAGNEGYAKEVGDDAKQFDVLLKQKMADLRVSPDSKAIENSTDDFIESTKTVTIFAFLFLGYVAFHHLYNRGSEGKEKTTTVIAITGIVSLLLMSLYAWFSGILLL